MSDRALRRLLQRLFGDAVERGAKRNIRRHGVHLTYVPEDDEGPSFAYTAGLAALEHSEFIIFGESVEFSATVLNATAERVMQGTLSVHENAVIDDYGSGVPMAYLELPRPEEWVTIADLLFGPRAGGARVRAFQVVFTDADGRWPWDENPAFGATSSVLGETPDIARLPRLPY